MLVKAYILKACEGCEVSIVKPCTLSQAKILVTQLLLYLSRWLGMCCRAVRVVPKPFRRLTQPAQLGLRILRIATWVASFLMSAVLFRRGCHWIAHSSITKMTRWEELLLFLKGWSTLTFKCKIRIMKSFKRIKEQTNIYGWVTWIFLACECSYSSKRLRGQWVKSQRGESPSKSHILAPRV